MALLGKIFARGEKKPKGKAAAAVARPAEDLPAASAPERRRAPAAGKFSGAGAGVLVKAHTTEKTARARERGGYVFAVAEGATKRMIRAAVEARYGVKVRRVRTSRTHGKERRRGRITGWKPGLKKAVVGLREGQNIETL